MNICISATELRKALRDIEAAEKNGFYYCLAVMGLETAGPMLTDCRMRYSDMAERAHPTDGNFDWGRFQGVTRRNRFKDGKLVPIEETKKRAATKPRKR